MPGFSGSTNNTAERIMDAAETRVQHFGFNGFSYADIAGELGVTTASIHYHFPTKADLGARLIERYTDRFMAALAEIEANPFEICEKLNQYVALYEAVLASDRLCLCGMLAAEYETLAAPMRERLSGFFTRNEDWLSALFDKGRRNGQIDFSGDARERAAALVSSLEGAMLVARAHGGVKAFRSSAKLMLMSLCGQMQM